MLFHEMNWAIGKSHDAELQASCPSSRGYRRDYLSHVSFAPVSNTCVTSLTHPLKLAPVRL